MKFRNVLAAVILSSIIMLLLLPPDRAPEADVYKPQLSGDLDDYLSKSESFYPDIRPGTEKKIIWFDTRAKNKTPYAVVYLHGFSASRQETAPLCDLIASNLGANLFYTRLRGHGRSNDAMAEATVSAWKQDAVEALEIGRFLGEKIILVGASTGGTLATWLVSQDTLSDIFSLILLSPNFGPRDKKTALLTWPGADVLVPLFMGKQHTWRPHNEQQAHYWTTTYPSVALLPMIQLVQEVNKINFEKFSSPTLFIYSLHDKVVDAGKTDAVYKRFPKSGRKVIQVEECGDPSNHIVAGDILSPQNTEILAEEIIAFVRSF